MKLVWVYTGQIQPISVSMLRLSVLSAHLFHPDLEKVCICPEGTAAELKKSASRDFIHQNIDFHIIPVKTPDLDAKTLSRWLKVRVYQIINESCLFLDTDTLIVKRLNFAEVHIANIGAAINKDGIHGIEIKIDNFVKDRFNKLNWPWKDEYVDKYLNSGVIFYKKNKLTEKFVAEWINNWTKFQIITNEHYDQLAFNHTYFTTNLVTRLPDGWNAPVAVLPQKSSGAVIYHYYSSSGSNKLKYTIWGKLIQKDIYLGLQINDIKKALNGPKPFVFLGGHSQEYFLSKQYIFYFFSKFYELCSFFKTGIKILTKKIENL